MVAPPRQQIQLLGQFAAAVVGFEVEAAVEKEHARYSEEWEESEGESSVTNVSMTGFAAASEREPVEADTASRDLETAGLGEDSSEGR